MKANILSATRVASLGLILALSAGCDGGGDDDEIDFQGTVRTQAVPLGNGVQGVTVCALGECSTTDAEGNWGFSIDDDDFDGGDVLFALSGANVQDQVVVPDISDESEEVDIIFVTNGTNQVQGVLVDEDDGDLEEQVGDDRDDGDDGDRGDFQGTVRTQPEPLGNGVQGVVVCALGRCSETDADGDWGFDVDDDDFDGGDVLFTLSGANVQDQVVVSGIPEESDDVNIVFVTNGTNQVQGVQVIEDDGDDDREEDIDDEDDDIEDDIEDETEDEIDEADDDIEDIGDEIDEEADEIEDEIDEETDDED